MNIKAQREAEAKHTQIEHDMCMLFHELKELNPNRDTMTLLTVLRRYRVHLTDNYFKTKDGE